MIWSIDFDSGAGSGDEPQVNGAVVYSTDGTCGPANGNTYCSSSSAAYNGTCCSGSSFCGSGEVYCGTGCLSGCEGTQVLSLGSGYVYIDPSIWTDPNPQVYCEPPCVLILPPLQLSSMTTISFEPITTELVAQSMISSGSTIQTILVTVETTIYIPALTTSELDLWAITIFANDTTLATFTPVQSVAPLPILITIPGSDFLEPLPSAPSGSMSTTSGSTSTTMLLPPILSASQTITVQPEPTYRSITLPEYHTVTYSAGGSSGGSGPTCLVNCGKRSCLLWPPFLCGSSCGIFGCSTGCGVLGCGNDCPLCDTTPFGSSGSGGSGGPPPPPPPQSPTPSQISMTTTTSTSSCTPGTAIDCNTMCYIMDTVCTTSCFSVTNACTPVIALPFPFETPEVQFDLGETDDEVISDAEYIASFMNPILFLVDPVKLNGTYFLDGFSTSFNPGPGLRKHVPSTQTAAPLSIARLRFLPSSTAVENTSTHI